MFVAQRLWPAALAAVVLATASCGVLQSSPKIPLPTPPRRVDSGTARNRGHASSVHWPGLITRALAQGGSAFKAPLLAPTRIPRGNSVQVAIAPSEYSVALYACPSRKAPNSPLIGQGSCGALYDVAEAFGAMHYGSRAAVTAATRYTTPPGSPVRIHLAGGVTADSWSDPGSSTPLAIAWRQGDWHVVVSGGTSMRAAADRLVALLAHETLPAGAGLLTEDLSGGGAHTSLQWAIGTTVYFASASHTPAHALALADSMERYPG